MKKMPDTFSIYFACLQISPFETVISVYSFWAIPSCKIRKLAQVKHFPNRSMLASQQIKTVKPPDKKPGISDRLSFCVGVALKFSSFGRNCVTTLKIAIIENIESARGTMGRGKRRYLHNSPQKRPNSRLV